MRSCLCYFHDRYVRKWHTLTMLTGQNNSLDIRIFTLFLVHHLTSSFAAVILTTATRGHLNICCNNLLAQLTFMIIFMMTELYKHLFRICITSVIPTTWTVCVSVTWHPADPSDFTHSPTENVALIWDDICTSSWPCFLVRTISHAGKLQHSYCYHGQFPNIILHHVRH